ncbi:MAG: hypothetical protein PHN86_08515 [Proteiniphilum sp.]|nr:hypothetical protein [Proteiniphilum sp.]
MYLAEGQSVAICEKGAEAAIYGSSYIRKKARKQRYTEEGPKEE